MPPRQRGPSSTTQQNNLACGVLVQRPPYCSMNVTQTRCLLQPNKPHGTPAPSAPFLQVPGYQSTVSFAKCKSAACSLSELTEQRSAVLPNTSEYSQLGLCSFTPGQHLRDENLTLQEASVRARWSCRQRITWVSLAPLTGRQFAPHSTALEGMNVIPIRSGFNSQYRGSHDTQHPSS